MAMLVATCIMMIRILFTKGARVFLHRTPYIAKLLLSTALALTAGTISLGHAAHGTTRQLASLGRSFRPAIHGFAYSIACTCPVENATLIMVLEVSLVNPQGAKAPRKLAICDGAS